MGAKIYKKTLYFHKSSIEKFFYLASSKVIMFGSDIVISVSIPLLFHEDILNLSFFRPVWTIYNDTFLKLSTISTAIMYNNKKSHTPSPYQLSQELNSIQLNDCKIIDTLYSCPQIDLALQPIEHSCLSSLYHYNDEQTSMQECEWISRLDTLHPRVTAIKQQKYVIATNKEIVLEEKCPSKIEQKYIKLQKGNHILSLGSACELHVVEPLHSFTIRGTNHIFKNTSTIPSIYNLKSIGKLLAMNIALPIKDVNLSNSFNKLENLTSATDEKVRTMSQRIRNTTSNNESWIANDIIPVILFSALSFIAILGGIVVLKYCSKNIM